MVSCEGCEQDLETHGAEIPCDNDGECYEHYMDYDGNVHNGLPPPPCKEMHRLMVMRNSLIKLSGIIDKKTIIDLHGGLSKDDLAVLVRVEAEIKALNPDTDKNKE